ncbi:response regulator [Ornithinimicrobium cryptoxanthini]|uniref:Response regulator transcription factor n=1 Tax=Ornithinimicrobium cryptoxanthini TaxID=2934161 RepID=A0ABY4YDG5_9MICO|nr:response regulator transcription factor [Ornithinimicrobium cryptoxanthini]USQ74768.1 response regulator transcription factor [Ornithinimicrobium cryptoxanthini]
MTGSEGVEPVIRVVLADDHRLFREGVASLLQRAPDLDLVGSAASGEEAIALVDELGPEVVLMDLNMPGLGGIAATRELRARHPEVGVVVLTMLEDDASVFAALQAGARGYVLKDAERGDLVRAIRAVASGEALLGAPVAQRVLDQFGAEPAAPAPPTPTPATHVATEPPGDTSLDRLTPRELEVLRLIAAGQRNSDIAETLVISHKTVGNHISSIFAKLHIRDRVHAVLRARQAGLGDEGP